MRRADRIPQVCDEFADGSVGVEVDIGDGFAPGTRDGRVGGVEDLADHGFTRAESNILAP